MSIPASSWAAILAAVDASMRRCMASASTSSPRLRCPCISASADGRGRLPAWVVRILVALVSTPAFLPRSEQRGVGAAVDLDGGAGEIPRVLRAEECGDAAEVVRVADLARRHARRRVAALAVQRGH